MRSQTSVKLWTSEAVVPELLRMPEVAANTSEATLAGWPVAERTQYAARDVIAVVETAKASIDLEAESDGVILKILVPAGSDALVGSSIALIGQPGEQVDDIDDVLRRLGVATEVSAGASRSSESSVLSSSRPLSEPQLMLTDSESLAPTVTTDGRVFSSPLARRLAREAGINPGELVGSGPNGRVVRKDVEAAVLTRTSNRETLQPPRTVASAQGLSGTYVSVPHSRMRRAIAARLTQSKQTIPHFYVRGSARVDDLLSLRSRLNEHSRIKISVNDLLLKAVALAHLEVPDLNVLWSDDAVQRAQTVDIAIAVATESGLVTPVVRDVERISLSTIAGVTREFASRAREGRLQSAELVGGTCTITNLGMYGTEEFGAIINPPQSTILAVGAAQSQPVVSDEGKIVPATVLKVVLSVDHRPIDGAVAAQWMAAFLKILESPLRIAS
jgi:pyruvate dehydrogenase E2 component (dihydrolipoamide acetyltransferase)